MTTIGPVGLNGFFFFAGNVWELISASIYWYIHKSDAQTWTQCPPSRHQRTKDHVMLTWSDGKGTSPECAYTFHTFPAGYCPLDKTADLYKDVPWLLYLKFWPTLLIRTLSTILTTINQHEVKLWFTMSKFWTSKSKSLTFVASNLLSLNRNLQYFWYFYFYFD